MAELSNGGEKFHAAAAEHHRDLSRAHKQAAKACGGSNDELAAAHARISESHAALADLHDEALEACEAAKAEKAYQARGSAIGGDAPRATGRMVPRDRDIEELVKSGEGVDLAPELAKLVGRD